MDANTQEQSNSETLKRVLKLINYYNPSFTDSDLNSLITKGSIDYFLSSVNRMPKNAIERNDSEAIHELINQIRN